jgi:hypothetical protein
VARQLTGSVMQVGRSWQASVPRVRGSRQRLHCSFPTEAEARAWLAAQVARLREGLEAEPASPVGRVANRHGRDPAKQRTKKGPRTFEDHARAWHDEHYVQLHSADAERTRAVLDNLERHLFPVFGGPIDPDVRRARAALVGWTRTMAGYPAEPGGPEPTGRTYEAKTVSSLLWILSEVYRYAHLVGADVAMVASKGGPEPAITQGIHALPKRGKEKRKPTLVSLTEARAIAAELHVIHQLVLWLMRVAGLRIGEAYGLVVGNFVELDGWGHLLVEAQGGKTFFVRDRDEQVVPTTRKTTTKTKSGYRLIALPPSLAALVRTVIDAFHTDPTSGDVDADARLVPTIRSQGGGRAGFENALRGAARGTGTSGDPEAYVIPHDLRKHYATDLAWSDVDSLTARRAMGHRAGTDVFDLVYTLDDRLKEAMRPAAQQVEDDITKTIGTLITPTTRRPTYGKGVDPVRRAAIDAALAAAGWQVDEIEGWIDAAEAAAHLGLSVIATRRLFPDEIPAEKVDGAWRARLDDVIAYRDRLADWQLLDDLAEELGHDYHLVHRTMTELGIAPRKDPRTRRLLLTPDEAGQIRGELDRLAQLDERSVTVAVAAGMLGVRHGTIHAWARAGKLDYDPETNRAGRRSVTRASIDAELARRGTPRKTTVTAEALKEYADLDDAGVRALVRAGHLVRARSGGYTVASVRSWATGYRPDLLTTGLLAHTP